MKYVIMSLTADKLAAQNKASSKVAKRVVPAYRRLFSIFASYFSFTIPCNFGTNIITFGRAKVRGVLLQDTDNTGDN